MAYFVLEETLPSKKIVVLEEAEERAPLLPNQEAAVEDVDIYQHDDSTLDSLETATEPERPLSLWNILSERSVWVPILMYGIIATYYIPYDEVFALYSRLDHSLGLSHLQLNSRRTRMEI